MKNILLSFSAVLAAVFVLTSCNDGLGDGRTVDPALVGTWEGTVSSSYSGSGLQPVGDPDKVVFVFTPDRFTWTRNGIKVIESPYICGKSLRDGSYFQWTEGATSGGNAVFYSISGRIMTINGANGSIILNLPAEMTKK